MRVALFHNRYLQRGGEDVAVEEQAELLEKAGHRVLRCIVDKSNGDHVEHAGRVVRGPDGRRELIWSSVGDDRVETFREWVWQSDGQTRYSIHGMGRYGDALVLIDNPLPTSALFASFHSGRCALIQIPPPGTRLHTFATAGTSSFSIRLTCLMAPRSPASRRPSAPISSTRRRTAL